MKGHPDSAKLMRAYAEFLNSKKMDFKQAKIYYEKSTICDGKNIVSILNYAWFLRSDHEYKDLDKAELYYEKSLEIDSNYVYALYHYAMFLQDDRKNDEKADQVLFC